MHCAVVQKKKIRSIMSEMLRSICWNIIKILRHCAEARCSKHCIIHMCTDSELYNVLSYSELTIAAGQQKSVCPTTIVKYVMISSQIWLEIHCFSLMSGTSVMAYCEHWILIQQKLDVLLSSLIVSYVNHFDLSSCLRHPNWSLWT